MCGSKTTKTTSSGTSSGTQSSTPNNAPLQQDLYNRGVALPSTYTPYDGTMVAGTNAQQQQGFDQIRDGSNMAHRGIMGAMDVSKSLTGYQPQQVTGQGYQAVMAGGNGGLPGVQADRIAGAPQVVAERFPDANLASYMNPWTEQVVNNTARQIGTANQQQIAANQAAATAAGAYGGSRHGRVDVGTNEASQRVLGDASGQLYARGFDTAQAAISNDQNRAFQASSQNANNALQVGMANAGNSLQAGLTNAGLASNMAQFNAGSANRAAEYGAGAANAAAFANQNADLAGAGMRLNASGQMGNQAVTAQNSALQGGQAQIAAGSVQQQTDQADADAKYQEWRTAQQFPYQALQFQQGLMPDLGTQGTNTNRYSGTQTTVEPRNIVGDIVNAGTQLYGAYRAGQRPGAPGGSTTPGQGSPYPQPVPNGGFPQPVNPGVAVPGYNPYTDRVG